MAWTVATIAEWVEGRVEGDAQHVLHRVAPIEDAGPEDLTFLVHRRYLGFLGRSRPGAILVTEDLAGLPEGLTLIRVRDPYLALTRVLPVLYPEPEPRPGVAATAVVGRGARLGVGALVGPYAVIEDDVLLGDRVRVGAHSVVGRGAEIGADTELKPHVTVYPGTVIGARCILHSGARLGCDGFGYVWDGSAHRKVPQVGRCVIEDDVEIGANTTIDRGSIGETRIGTGTKIDNLVHIAHNVRMGRHCVLAAQVGIAGSVRLGDGVACGGQVGISGHLEVGSGARLAAQSGVIGDVPAGATFGGYPAREHRLWIRAMAEVYRLPETVRRLQRVEALVKGLRPGRRESRDA
ncbi:MAG: UDP-3-O-(3-hydroxymyristoyl)glucosamine N-acyltransferase [Gemmatimonadetes bacterium]|nr:UDP-3-O-(3-hydroxymyristoyl)glucosamine N-acyltransferase [Gemmatimonadota bacterium]